VRRGRKVEKERRRRRRREGGWGEKEEGQRRKVLVRKYEGEGRMKNEGGKGEGEERKKWQREPTLEWRKMMGKMIVQGRGSRRIWRGRKVITVWGCMHLEYSVFVY
jgi:hypothetical protein